MENLYRDPPTAFPDKWIGWGKFLGNGKLSNKKPGYWVSVAERLARNNKGVLPNSKWLTTNGYTRVQTAKSKYPEMFRHIRQDKKLMKPGEWVSVAVALAKENSGSIPNASWLIGNGYGGLYYTIKSHPELFDSIGPVDRKLRPPKDWVPIAEGLADENGGLLPGYKWLVRNGYSGLAQSLNRHPELFRHIAREFVRSRDPGKWVAIAERLANESGGSLPGTGWLQKNGYYGVYMAKKKNPSLFAHIPQERRDSQGRLIDDSREEVG